MAPASWTSGASPAARARPADGLRRELGPAGAVLRDALSLGVPLSIDTYKAEVMRQRLDLGADIINDIRGAARTQGAVEVVARTRAAGCA
jgi:dihydropteroate synthase